MSYVWRMWGKRDIQRHDKREAMYFHKAGSLSVSCKSCKIVQQLRAKIALNVVKASKLV